MRKIKRAFVIENSKIKNKHKCGRDPTLRKKCPECDSKSYVISAPMEHTWEVKNGKKVLERRRRLDAGCFTCTKCGYYEDM